MEIANCVRSIRRLTSAAASVKGMRHVARGKMEIAFGQRCSVKRERPARIARTERSPSASSTICAPSGGLRTMS